MLRTLTVKVVGACMLYLIAANSVAADSKASGSNDESLKIELNAVIQQKSACRISILVTNGLQKPLADLAVELVLFDVNQQVLRLLSASIGAMPNNKARLKQYDLPGLSCQSVGRILLNGVTLCKAELLTAELCTAKTRTSSRAKIPFDY